MARTVNPNSAGSQFFIMVDDAPYLDGEYAAFGRVTSGMEEVDRIVSVPRDYDDKPLEEEKIESVTVETFGETYAEPEKGLSNVSYFANSSATTALTGLFFTLTCSARSSFPASTLLFRRFCAA